MPARRGRMSTLCAAPRPSHEPRAWPKWAWCCRHRFRRFVPCPGCSRNGGACSSHGTLERQPDLTYGPFPDWEASSFGRPFGIDREKTGQGFLDVGAAFPLSSDPILAPGAAAGPVWFLSFLTDNAQPVAFCFSTRAAAPILPALRPSLHLYSVRAVRRGAPSSRGFSGDRPG